MNRAIFHLVILAGAIAISSSVAFGWSFGMGGVNYPDQEMKDFYPKIKERYLKMRQILDKNQKCAVAIDGFMSRYYRQEVADHYLPNTVTCIQDIVENEGTLKEKKGCYALGYNLSQDRYTEFFNRYFPQPLSSKPCESGGFEELLAKRGWWSGDGWQNSTVEETLFTPKKLDEPWQWVLVYAKSEKYVKWFSEARARGKAFVQKKQSESAKKKGSSN